MDSWSRIEMWLRDNAPETYRGLKEPATEDAIRSAESVLPGPIPDEFRDLYRRHDGQSGVTDPIAGDWELLSLTEVVSKWKMLKELLDKGTFAKATAIAKAIGPVRTVWWSEQWIPFAYDGVGDLQCIDLDPPEGGKVGQVVTYWHDRGEREHVADSLNEWLARLADDLEAGKYSRAGNSC